MGPSIVRAAIPQSMGIIPRPRKMNPVQEKTFLLTSGLRVENVRMAVVCQHVSMATQNSNWKKI